MTSYVCTVLVCNLGNNYPQFGNLMQDCINLLYPQFGNLLQDCLNQLYTQQELRIVSMSEQWSNIRHDGDNTTNLGKLATGSQTVGSPYLCRLRTKIVHNYDVTQSVS